MTVSCVRNDGRADTSNTRRIDVHDDDGDAFMEFFWLASSTLLGPTKSATPVHISWCSHLGLASILMECIDVGLLGHVCKLFTIAI